MRWRPHIAQGPWQTWWRRPPCATSPASATARGRLDLRVLSLLPQLCQAQALPPVRPGAGWGIGGKRGIPLGRASRSWRPPPAAGVGRRQAGHQCTITDLQDPWIECSGTASQDFWRSFGGQQRSCDAVRRLHGVIKRRRHHRRGGPRACNDSARRGTAGH